MTINFKQENTETQPTVKALTLLDSDKRDAELLNLFDRASHLATGGMEARLFFIPVVIGCANHSAELRLSRFSAFSELENVIKSCIESAGASKPQVALCQSFMTRSDAMNCSAKSLKLILKDLVDRLKSGKSATAAPFTNNREVPSSFIEYVVGCYQIESGNTPKIDHQRMIVSVAAMLNFESVAVDADPIRVLPLSSFNTAIVDGTVECIHLIKDFIGANDSDEEVDSPGKQAIFIELMPDEKRIVLYGQRATANISIDPILMGNEGMKKIVDAGFVNSKYVPSRTTN